MRQIVALGACLALLAPVLPSTAFAGGRPLAPRSLNAVGANVTHGGILPPLPGPTSAFGSPGGYPLPLPGSPEVRLAPKPVVRAPHRGPHRVGSRFPVPTVFYTPAALYDPTPLYQPPIEPPQVNVNVSPVVYVSPTIYVSPAAAAPVPVAPPAPPSVVEYPTGRYELRGDGGATPYAWVWVPNPPPAPPVAAAPPEQPRVAGATGAARSPVYRFTDDEGTVIWTNQVEKVPEPLRAQVQRGRPNATSP
jgi:hypothetical protein